MDTYTLHIAMAALVSASFVAVSAYYIHRKTLDQVLENAKNVEKDDDDDDEQDDDLQHYNYKLKGSNSSSQKASRDRGYRRASTLPLNSNGGHDVVDFIPAGLPKLQTIPEGKSTAISGLAKRASLIVRATSPKSPVVSATTFESVEEESDEEVDVTDTANQSAVHLNTNGSTVPESVTVKANGEKLPIPTAALIRLPSIAANILRKEPEQDSFVRVKINQYEAPSPDEAEVYKALQGCLEMRDCYVFRENIPPWEKEVITDPSTPKRIPNPFDYLPETKSDHHFEMVDGVVHVYAKKDLKENLFPIVDATTFFTDFHHILKVIANGETRTVCHHRLGLLEQKFNLHLMLNADKEFLAQKSAPHRDFYNVRKVDTHVHHSACMNQKHLLRFIKSKLKKEPDEVVIFRDGTYMTLREVFESLDLSGYDLNVDLLDVHADKTTFHRFDKFNLKYNPCGQSRLREIFLKQDNLIQGRFLAELTQQVFTDLEASKYQMAEYRISIYGRKQSEWDNLASWIVNNELYSENVVWLIQLPRLYNIYKGMGIVSSFQTILDNIFLPLFEVTIDPGSHPQLHVFLKQVVGLDLVDDESKPERRPTKHMPTPEQWNNVHNPAFAYYVYYCYANLYTLNKLRELKGMNTIRFRPHCGEAGDIDHLAASFLTTHSISHGINLRKSPVLQYLYYLSQIGLAMSPLSNNSLFLDYHRNPFPIFFARGLNVSLSTDDPLQIHLTKEPLVEEYSIAASVWKLSSCDLCEIARNSVYQSGFSHAQKSHWIGQEYYKTGPDGNDIHKTNVPRIRLEFRDMVWKEEMHQVYLGKPYIPEHIES